MLVQLLCLSVALAVLLYSSDMLVDVAVKIAKLFKVSSMAIGLTVVSVGTSLPEVITSAVAAYENHPEIAIGNVVGSNICNIGLFFGLTGLFCLITCKKNILLKDGGIMIMLSAFIWALSLFFGELSRFTGVALLIGFVLYIYSSLSSKNSALDEELEAHELKETRTVLAIKLFFSFTALLLSSKYLVDSAVSLAMILGVSKNVIAISLVAFGTSVPELSVSISAARKRQTDILVGNIVGSNIANILLVLGLAAVIRPLNFDRITTLVDLPIMIAFALLAFLFLYRGSGVTKPKALIFLLAYALVIWRCVVFPV